jgi:hypothetical protein
MEYDVPHLSAFMDRLTKEFIGQLGKIPWYEEEDVKTQKVDTAERMAAQPPFLESGKVFCRAQEVADGVQVWLSRLLIDDSNRNYPEYEDDPRIVALTEDFPDSALPDTVAKTIRTGIALQRIFPTSVDVDTVRVWAQSATAPLRAIAESGDRRLLEYNEEIGNISNQYKAVIRSVTALNVQLGDITW